MYGNTFAENASCFHQRLLAGSRSPVDEQGILEESGAQPLLGTERGNG